MEDIPVLNIDLTDLTSESYTQLMDEIRALFVNRAEHTYRGVPVTTNEEGYHIISLDHAGFPSVLLLINQKDCYLVGFRDGRNQWYRFSDQDAFPAHAEVIRHMTSSYLSLVDKWEQVAVGPISALDAYHTLRNFNNQLAGSDPLVETQKRAFARLIVMLCEGVRLRTVRTLVSRLMGLFMNEFIDLITQKKITSWSLMSGFAAHCWRREHDGINGYEQHELDKLARCEVHSPEEVAGDPNGELMLILYQVDHFGGIV